MRSAWGWSVVVVLVSACGCTDLESPPLVAFIEPAEQTITQGATASFRASGSDSAEEPVIFGWRLFSRPSVTFASLSNQGANAEHFEKCIQAGGGFNIDNGKSTCGRCEEDCLLNGFWL